MLNLVRYIWTNIPGPKVSVVVMSIIVGFANGAMLSAINGAISARVDGTFDWTYPAIFLLSVTAFFVGGYFAMYRATDMAQGFTMLLRQQTVEKVNASALRDVERYGRGDIYAHITRDAWTVGSTWTRMVKGFQALLVVAFCMIYLAWLSPVVFLLAVAVIGVGVRVYFVQEKYAKVHLKSARRNEAKLFGGVSDLLDGFKEAKLSREVADDLVSDLKATSADARRDFVRAEFLFYATSIVSKAMLFLLLGVIAFLPAEYIGTSAALAFQILALLLYLVPPLEQLVDIVGPFMQAEVAKQNLDRLTDSLTPEEAARVPAVLEQADALTLDKVEMDYSDPELGTTFTLGPIDLTINRGEIVFLVGGNGSGKTTMMKVLAGLYLPDRGEMRLGGEVLGTANLGTWRDQVASVFHDFHLFDKAFGLDARTARPLIQAELERVNLQDKVTLNDDGSFSTTRLSTGQRKRLALVLARAQRRPVLLMDEFGAEQDPEFRAFFYTDYLEALRAEGISVVAVTHDDRYFGTCDRLIKMDLGRVVYDGPPDPASGDAVTLRTAHGG
ncbi:cyclic peptide export ABC transporter [Pseudooceanicola sp. LIPI14-2-Ac024]|uniref:cyclic peptide export ABC transporter n=1 Tax=Pseudooceanicola sp. LIPI14-2-Ac024 TaxID=3344875 RepID=UPI0035CFE5F8